jgi:hypothetical protein
MAQRDAKESCEYRPAHPAGGAGTDLCEVEHVGLVVSGTAAVKMRAAARSS